MDKKLRNICLSIAGLLLLLIVALNSFTIMSAGSVGVVTLFGDVQQEVLMPGFHLINPLKSVHTINVRIKTTSLDSQAASNDLQTVATTLTVNYSINPINAKPLFIKVGDNVSYLDAGIINPAINEAFKTVVANYNAEELIDKRSSVSNDIVKLLGAKLEPYGIIVQSISVTNFKFSSAFDEAIEAKVVAAQKVLTAQNELQKAKVSAQQKVVEAQANADAMNIQKQAVTPELIELKQLDNQKLFLDRWNGVLPTTMLGNNPTTMLNLNK